MKIEIAGKERILDVSGGTWAVVREWLRFEREQLRKRNDNPKLDIMATSEIRGEIGLISRLLRTVGDE